LPPQCGEKAESFRETLQKKKELKNSNFKKRSFSVLEIKKEKFEKN
jgi:hypothetical protein